MLEEEERLINIIDKDPYKFCLECAGAKVLAFESFGSHQGDWFSKIEYGKNIGWVRGYYGSCSGCDAFEGEFGVDCYDSIPFYKLKKFGEVYLEDIITFEKVYEYAKKIEAWDLEANDIIKFLEENK